MKIPDLRSAETRHFGPLFEYKHLAGSLMRDVSRQHAALAEQMINLLPDGPELTAGLRKLLEAKDCMVRAALVALDARIERLQLTEGQ